MGAPQSRPWTSCTDYWSFFGAENFRKFNIKTGNAVWAGLKDESFLTVAADLIIDSFVAKVTRNAFHYFGPSEEGNDRFLVMNTKHLAELVRFVTEHVVLAAPWKYKGAQVLLNGRVLGKNFESDLLPAMVKELIHMLSTFVEPRTVGVRRLNGEETKERKAQEMKEKNDAQDALRERILRGLQAKASMASASPNPPQFTVSQHFVRFHSNFGKFLV
jgi:hypothetical protein